MRDAIHTAFETARAEIDIEFEIELEPDAEIELIEMDEDSDADVTIQDCVLHLEQNAYAGASDSCGAYIIEAPSESAEKLIAEAIRELGD